MDLQISPQELKQRLAKGEALHVLDVREPFEYDIANLGGQLIPLGELVQRIDEIDKTKETVVLCHHGVRSAQATVYLRQNGFPNVRNLSGGIARWSSEIDPSVPQY